MTTDAGERSAWAAGTVFVLALVAEGVISTGVGLTQNDSAATIAAGLHAHEGRLLAVAALSIVYAVAFVVYLWKLHLLLRGAPERPAGLSTLVLIGLVLFVSLHAVSDIGITGMLGATVAAYSAQHDPGLGGVIATFGLMLDLIGFVLLLVIVAASSAVLLRRPPPQTTM